MEKKEVESPRSRIMPRSIFLGYLPSGHVHPIPLSRNDLPPSADDGEGQMHASDRGPHLEEGQVP